MRVLHQTICVSLLITLLTTSVEPQGSLSENVELFWNLYHSVVRGSRILRDVTEGAGAVSKAIKAIDDFLDTKTAESQLSEAINEIQDGEGEAAALVDTPTEEMTPGVVEDPTCDMSSEGGDLLCEVTPESRASRTKANSGAKSRGDKEKTSTTVQAKEPPQQMPTFNGCGALGFHIRDSNLPVTKMTDCCGLHDICYSSSCRVNKRSCDSKLRSCLFSVCDGKSLERSLQKTCVSAAKLLFSGTMALSFQQYKEAQQQLKCRGKRERRRRRR